MSKTKSIIFIVLFVAALICVGRILYSQQNADLDNTSPQQASSELFPSSSSATNSEVLGVSRAATSTNPGILAQSEYTKDNSLKHLSLTRDNIIWYTNYERVKNKLNPLATNQLLINSAQGKNSDMLEHQYFNHVRDGNPGVGFDTFIDAQNYEFIKIGENLAMGDFSTSAEVVTAWMKSPSHRKNILDPIYHDIGVHIKNGTINDRKVTLVTQHFGDPRSSCPPVNTETKKAIDTLRIHITELQNNINEEQKNVTQTGSMFDPRVDSLVENYNKLISVYNESIKAMGELVSDYNKQVRQYDQCIQGKR